MQNALDHAEIDEIIGPDVQAAAKPLNDSTALGADLWEQFWFKNMSIEVAQARAHGDMANAYLY